MRRYWAIVALLVAAILVVTLSITYGLLRLGRSPQPAPDPAAEAPPSPNVGAPQTKRMLLASRYLSVGTLLGEDDVVPDALEVGRIPAGAIPESSADDILGTAVRVPIDAGTPLLVADLVYPGARGFLSLLLSPGMRAVSVKIEPETRFSGLVDPGDRVDVIFTASAPPTDHLLDVDVDGAGGGLLSRVVFEDIRVLAIDRTVRPPAVGGEDPVEERLEFTTATLEVSPAQAPFLVHANREGQIALAIRAAQAAPDPVSSVSAVHIQDLIYPNARPKPPQETEPIAAEIIDEPMAETFDEYVAEIFDESEILDESMKGVNIYRARSMTEERKVFPDTGPPRIIRIPARIPTLPAPFPGLPAPSPPSEEPP